MRKNFLLLLWLTLLPLAGWAQTEFSVSWKDGATIEHVSPGAQPAFQDLLDVRSSVTGEVCIYTTPYSWLTANSDGGGYVNCNKYNYSVHTSSDDATNDVDPVTGDLVKGMTYYLRVWGRCQGSGYTNLRGLKVMEFIAGKAADVTGISLATGLKYADGPQSLVSGEPTYPADYVTTVGGVEYIVKDAEVLPAPTDAATGETAENVGTYYVYYRVKNDGGEYFTSDWKQLGTSGVVIAPRNITTADFTVTAASPTWDGTDQALLSAFTWTDDFARSLTADDVLFSTDESTWNTLADFKKTDANEAGYPVYVKITGNANHNDLASTLLTTVAPILKADLGDYAPAPAAAAAKITYNGGLQELIAAGVIAGGDVWYQLEDAEENVLVAWTKTAADIKAKNAATYTVKYYAEGDANHNDKGSATSATSFTVTINQAQFTVNQTLADAGVVYNAEDQSILKGEIHKGTGMPAGTVKYTIGEEVFGPQASSSPSFVKKTNAGTYEVAWEAYPKDEAEAKNYIPAKGTVTATISRAPLHMGAQGKNVTYGTAVSYYELIQFDDTEIPAAESLDADGLKDLLVTFVSFEGGTIDAGKVTELPTDAGEWDFVLGKNDDGSNYELKNFIPDGTLTITKIDATPATVAAATLTYNGNDQELVTIPEPTDADGGTQLYYLETEETGAGPIPAGDARWSEDIPVATKAGEYNVWTMIKGDKNHNDVVAAAKVANVKIAQKNIADAVFTINPASSTYTGLNQNETVITVVPDAAEPMDVAKDIKSVTLPATVVTKGEYDVTIEGQGNYTGTTTAKFTINQNTVNNASVAIAGWTYGEYDDVANAPQVTADFGAATVKYEYSVKDANDWKDEVPTEANNYTVRATIAETADYAGATATADFTIAKANAAIAAKTAGINRTYNGKEQALVEAAQSADGTFWYAEGETEPAWNDEDAKHEGWTESVVPTGLNAGNYTVYTKFVPDGNHNGATIDPVSVEMKKAALGYMLGGTTKTWNGESLTQDELATVFTLYTGELFENDAYDVPFVLTLKEDYKDAGTYNFTQANYTFKTKEAGYEKDYPVNYTINFAGTGTIIINKADIAESDFTAPAKKLGLIYNGKAQELVTAGEVTTKYPADETGKPIGTIKFSNLENGEYTTAIPTGIEASSYTVWYKVEGDPNHNDTKPALIQVTITEKELLDEFFVLTKNAKGTEYLKTDLMPTISTKEGEPITSDDYEVTITFNGEKVTELINAGEYTFTFTPTETSNYSGSAVQKWTITPRPAQAVAYNATKVYDGIAGLGDTEVEFAFTNLIPGDDDAIQMGDAVYFDKEAKNVGVYTMKFNLDAFESQNYEVIGVEDTKAVFEITKRPLTVSWNEEADGFTKIYGDDDATANMKATADNIVLTNAVAAEEAEIIANTVITRDEGEDIGKYGIALSANQITENNKKVDAHIFDNYAYTFGTAEDVFEIVPAEIIVSLKPQTKTYDGVKVKTLTGITADDLVVTHLKGGNVKDAVFTTLPTATITAGGDEGVVDAGEYELTLSGAEATNYTITTYMTSTFTVEPVMVNAQFNNKPVAVEGDDAKVIFDKVDWTVVADDDADAETVKAALGKDLFELQFTSGVVNDKGKIATDDGEDALVIVYKGKETPANFEFIEAYGDLNIGGENTEIALDDSKAVVTKATKKADVTFTQKRAVPEDVWQACVLPFTVSIEQLSDAFGYAAVDLFDPTRTNTEEVHFSLQVTGSIEAGTPFLFKTNNTTNFTDVMFEGVEVVATETLNPVVKDDDTNIQFIGVFEPVEFYGEQYRYLSKGTWYNAKNFSASKPVSLKPLRAYLDMEGAATARIFIEEPDGTVTAIDAVEFNNQAAEGMYNLNGMKVNQGLKGVYIQNGKKVIKK